MSVTATNRRVAEHEGGDFYPTPAWATKALLEAERFTGGMWDPACGNGAMCDAIFEAGFYQVFGSDLYDRGYALGVSGLDFLNCPPPKNPCNIITNPPYNLAEKFVERGLALAKGKLCLLLRLAFLEGAGRYNSLYTINPPARVHMFSSRITMYPNGEQTGGTGTTAYAWFVWEIGRKDRATELRWIAPRGSEKPGEIPQLLDLGIARKG